MYTSSATAPQSWMVRGVDHPAHAHRNAGRAEGVMRRLDADRSGTIGADEAAAAPEGSRLATGFARADADGDGQVTRAELTADIRASRRDGTPRQPAPDDAAPTASPESLFEALVKAADSDGDVRLSVEELKASPLTDLVSPHFAEIDGDGDGLLTSREVDAWEDARAVATAPDAAPVPEQELPAPPPTAPAPGPTDDGTTSATPAAMSLYESLFQALSEQPGAASVTLGRDVARQFLHLLADMA
jgi:hypothetical protein